jgi:hypothetical protein
MMREVVARLAARIGDRRRLLYAAVILVAAGIFASQIAALVWVRALRARRQPTCQRRR